MLKERYISWFFIIFFSTNIGMFLVLDLGWWFLICIGGLSLWAFNDFNLWKKARMVKKDETPLAKDSEDEDGIDTYYC